MRALLPLCAVLSAAAVEAAPTEWLEGTVLADCTHCATDAFAAERKALANQAGPRHEPASGMGYVVTFERSGPFVWGRAALVGTGNLIRTDAHVLFSDAGQLKNRGAIVYFEPMQHRGFGNAIEIDLSSVQRGGAVGPLETDVKNDWAIARLKEDAIAKFDGDRVFAFLWDSRVTHVEIAQPEYREAAALVLSREHTYPIDAACAPVGDDPSRYAFGVDEVFFVGCPSELLEAGVSGSALALWSPRGAWDLGGQLIAGGLGERASGESSVAAADRAFPRQLLLGTVPELKQMLAIVYLQELIRRGADPRRR